MSDLVKRVAKVIEHTGWGLQAEETARAAIAVVLQAVETEEIARSYDEDHRISRYIARENEIEL